MARQIVLLRGINLGPNRRVAMGPLREALTAAGFDGVRTLLASGNVLVDAGAAPDAVARRVHDVIESAFGLDVGTALMARPPELRPDGIFAVNDLLALGILQVMVLGGVRVPEDLA